MAMGSRRKKGPISDINVTPLVDVMLVLLVIFMVTAPLILNGIKLDLPKTKEVNKMNLNKVQVILSLDKTGKLFLGEKAIEQKKMVNLIKEEFKQNNTDTVFFRADYSIKYGMVAEIISHLKSSGILKIALITEIKNKKDE